MTFASEIYCLAKELEIRNVDQTRVSRDLCWSPELDSGRTKQKQMEKLVKERAAGKRVLEVGYSRSGRFIPSSKVLDLYDPRVDQIDYQLDACNMVGIVNESFDLVRCCAVLEHIPKFWLAAAEIQRVLAVGGVVWCGIPSVWPYHRDGVFKGIKVDFGGDFWRVTHQGMWELFDRCREIATWYTPATREAGDDPRCGWGVSFVGEKVK